MTLKSSSACYCLKRLRKRVPNSRSTDTEDALSRNLVLVLGTMKSVVSAERSLLRDRSRPQQHILTEYLNNCIFTILTCRFSAEVRVPILKPREQLLGIASVALLADDLSYIHRLVLVHPQ